MRISLFLIITLVINSCFERKKSATIEEEVPINKCEQIKFEDGSLIKLNRIYFDTLNIDSITVSRKRVHSSIVNGAFKGRFFFQKNQNYNLISDTSILNSIYTKYKLSDTNPSAILIKQNGCEFPLNTTMSPLELNNFENSEIVICSVYAFKIHCSERQYNHLIIYKIENEK